MGVGDADAEAGPPGPREVGSGGAGVRRLVRCLPVVAFVTWEFLLSVCLLFQYRCLKNFQNGADSYRTWTMVAGGMGIVFSLSPLLAVCDDTFKGSLGVFRSCGSDWRCLLKLVVGPLHLLFFASYCALMSMAADKAASITSVSQTVYLETSCQDSRILVIQERLTVGVKGTTISWVERNLPNQVEPLVLGLDNVQNISGLRITDTKRLNPNKWALHYETGQITTVRIEFDRRRYGFDLQLRYRARLAGNGGCDDGTSVCPVTGKSGMVKLNGGWEVYAPYANVETSVALAGCANRTCGSWSFRSTPMESEGLGLEVVLPAEVGVGTESCPLAWSVQSRNWFWCAGAACLALAAGICLCGVEFGQEKGIFLACALSTFFAVGAGALFAVAVLV